MRSERGPAPGDAHDFGDAAIASLRTAVAELSWLRTRGYSEPASLKLVGDRHQLTERQRKAVQRCACSDASRDRRLATRRELGSVDAILIDGFNCLIATESALSGAPVFRGRDSALRDLAGVHGTWRRLAVTDQAIRAMAALLTGHHSVEWLLDRPVSNSGRLRAAQLDNSAELGLDWKVEIVDDPDAVLLEVRSTVATSDARILDGCVQWVDLPGVVANRGSAWIVDLADSTV